ncbi:MAG: divergent PAP2 family protein [Patescibacteria group bacterium]|nr:divergent PAP2 family protein [Patescibacteria group bacterium]
MIYPIVIIPIIVGTIAQVMKFVLSVFRHKKIEVKYLFISGHMPSAHTAFVTSLATCMAYFDGINSSTFTISIVFAFIVIHDAVKIRMNIGENGKIVNKLIQEIPGIKKDNYPILRERVGHKPLEVLAGGVLGFILTILLIKFF